MEFDPKTMKKVKAVKRDREAGKYKTLEQAAKAHKISPATFYNYAKGLTEGSLTKSNGKNLTEKAIVKEIRTHESKIAELKEKLLNAILLKNK